MFSPVFAWVVNRYTSSCLTIFAVRHRTAFVTGDETLPADVRDSHSMGHDELHDGFGIQHVYHA